MRSQSYSYIKIKAIFNTKLGESIKICGSIEELGNWIPEKAVSLSTNHLLYPEWELKDEIIAFKGMYFEYKYLYYNENTGEYKWEELENNKNRQYYIEKVGSIHITDQEKSIFNKTTIQNQSKYSLLSINNKIDMNTENRNKNKANLFQINAESNLKKENKYNYINNLEYEENQVSSIFYESFNFYLNPKISQEDRIIIVTPFLPFEIEKHGQDIFTIHQSDENMIYSIMYRMKEIDICEVVWVGMLKNYTDYEEDDLYEIQNFLEDKNIHMIIPNMRSDYVNYWIYINNILRNIFMESIMNPYDEYLLNYEEYFNSYKTINQQFGIIIAKLVNPNDMIMINDVHLMLVPNFILTKNINSKIGIYFHQSFPSSDIIKWLPYHTEILKSILLCDVIGFHTFTNARNFLTSCKRILGIFYELKYKGFIILKYMGRIIIIRIMHAGIDIDYIKSISNYMYDKENEEIDERRNSDILINSKNMKRKNIYNDNENKEDESNQNHERNYFKDSYLSYSNSFSDSIHNFQVGQIMKNEYKTYINKYINLLKDKFSFVSIDNFEELSSLLMKFHCYDKFLLKLKEAKEDISKITFVQIIKNVPFHYVNNQFKEELIEIINEIHKKHGEACLVVSFVDKVSIPERLALFKLGSVLYYLRVKNGNCMYVCEFLAMKLIYKEETYSIKCNEKSKKESRTKRNPYSNESVMTNSRRPCYLISKYKKGKRNRSLKIKKDIVESIIKSYTNFDYGIIISELIGAPKILKSPIRVNPYHFPSVYDGLNMLYRMTSKQKYERLNMDYDFILNNTTFNWIKNFFIDMKRTNNIDSQKIAIGMGLQLKVMKLNMNFSQLNKKQFSEAYHNSKLRLFFLDYEGTLQVSDYKGCEETLLGYKPDQNLVKILRKLCENPNNLVFIVSGREKNKIDQWFGDIENLNLASEHGYYFKLKGNFNRIIKNINQENGGNERNEEEENDKKNVNVCDCDYEGISYNNVNNINNHDDLNQFKWEELFKITDWSWKSSVIKILEGFMEKTEGSYIYEKDTIISWYYRDCDLNFGVYQANEITTHLKSIFEYSKLDVVNGKGYVEIKQKGINKGYFISSIIKKLFINGIIPDFIFAVGDDTSDEEMFKYLSSIYTFLSYNIPDLKLFTTTIGKKPSSAFYFLNDTNEVNDYLELINRIDLEQIKFRNSSLTKEIKIVKQTSGFSGESNILMSKYK